VYLALLVVGFACNLASASTTAFSRRWGARRGSLITAVLRNVLGIPVWAAGFVLAARAPAPLLLSRTTVTESAGWLLVAAGGTVILFALATLRARAAKPSTSDALAHTGLYARVRHPIHSGTLLEFLGLALLAPRLPVLIACALGVVWILAQTWREELDLVQRLPEYRDYMRAVPRFVPRLRTQ
jgi:protein-S-isoprenylcysteine O-methyltransferase Ste14